MRRAAATVDAYLARVKGERRAALDAVRSAMRKLLPRAEEVIRYGMPAFRLEGGIVGGFAVTSTGCSYYPFSGRTLRTLADDLEGWSQTRGALHFGPERSLPPALLRKLVRVRTAEIRAAARRKVVSAGTRRRS